MTDKDKRIRNAFKYETNIMRKPPNSFRKADDAESFRAEGVMDTTYRKIKQTGRTKDKWMPKR